jgi:putative colanic acid biosynthesis glycosyltransferase WcaI
LGVLKEGYALRAGERLERWTYHRSTYVNAVTEGIRTTLIEHKGVPASKVLLLAHGVDTEMFHPGSPEPDLARELGWEGKCVFLYAGTLGIAQGLTVALDAMDALRQRDPKVLLAFIGDGSERKALEEAARERALANIRFYDPRPPEYIARLYRCASAGLATLRDLRRLEGVRPSKIFPVMASGKPVVYSGDGEGARLVASADAGIVVPPEDPVGLAAAIRTIAQNPAMAATLGANGRRYVEREHSWERVIGDWLKALPAQNGGGSRSREPDRPS